MALVSFNKCIIRTPDSSGGGLYDLTLVDCDEASMAPVWSLGTVDSTPASHDVYAHDQYPVLYEGAIQYVVPMSSSSTGTVQVTDSEANNVVLQLLYE